MGATFVSRRAARTRGRAPSERRAVTPAEAAWIAAVPCALLTLGAVLALAPTLARTLFPPRTYDFWPLLQAQAIMPEPTEHASYLIVLGGVLLLCGAVLVSRLRPVALGRATNRLLVWGAQALACAFLAVALVAQHVIEFGFVYSLGEPVHTVYFTWPTVAVAVLVALAIVVALRARALRPRLVAALRETPRRRAAALAIAALFTAIWLLTAINDDRSIASANGAVSGMLPWSMDETFAILDGRTPLVDFHAQYGQLWPYLVAATLSVVGTGMGVYTTTMATITGVALVAIFATLRRLTRSSLAALLLFLPLVATGFFMQRGPPENRYGAANLFTIFPVRYAGPYLLAWLVGRHLDGRFPRRASVLFLFAGLVALNNPEFGVPALGATLAACVWTRPPRTLRSAARLLGELAAGMLGALAFVALLTVVRSGSAPDFGLLFEFAKLYGVSGWAMLPMPTLGFHLVVLATFVAALTLATVRAACGERDVAMTGLLAWSGVFGLGAGAYYVGRSHPEVLVNLFSSWALALVLLVVLAARAVAARPSRWPSLPELAVLVGFGLAVCSIAQTPTPWSQFERLGTTAAKPPRDDAAAARFVERRTRSGERVVILNLFGHRIAYDLGLVNLSPYASAESIVTRHQLLDTVRILRAAHGRKIFAWRGNIGEEQAQTLVDVGFELDADDRASDTVEFVDRSRR